MVIGGVALIAIGGWLFVSGRRPGGVSQSGSPGVSGDVECPDGAEAWRSEGPAATFVVPIVGAKISVACAPAPSALQAYLDGWRGFDAGGAPTAAPAPGMPPTAFGETDQWTWVGLFSSIEGGGGTTEIDFTLPLMEIAARCQRRYLCVGGRWVAQAATRAVESEPSPTPTTFSISAEGVSTKEAVDLAMRAVEAWKAAEQANLDRAAFAAGCR